MVGFCLGRVIMTSLGSDLVYQIGSSTHAHRLRVNPDVCIYRECTNSLLAIRSALSLVLGWSVTLRVLSPYVRTWNFPALVMYLMPLKGLYFSPYMSSRFTFSPVEGLKMLISLLLDVLSHISDWNLAGKIHFREHNNKPKSTKGKYMSRCLWHRLVAAVFLYN